MIKNLLFVGLDVDENSFNASLISKDTGEVFYFKCKPTSGSLIKKLDDFRSRGYFLKICYESTYLGFALCRNLQKNNYDCQVIASSLIPTVPGLKVKTDKTDCKKLAVFYMQGLLTNVSIPTEDDEKVRDLIRSRSFLVEKSKSIKKHIIATCKRMNLDYKNEENKSEYWSCKYRTWLDQKIKNMSADCVLKLNLGSLVSILNQLECSIMQYDLEIEKISKNDRYKKRVDSLIVYRGIKFLTAMIIIAEIGDVNKFNHPGKLVSYLGMDIAEYSSGGKENKFGITKMGNKRARTALIEANQSSCTQPRVSRDLTKRRLGIDNINIEIADRCMKRLSNKGYMLSQKGKNVNVVKTACAIEMVGFIWESLKRVA